MRAFHRGRNHAIWLTSRQIEKRPMRIMVCLFVWLALLFALLKVKEAVQVEVKVLLVSLRRLISTNKTSFHRIIHQPHQPLKVLSKTHKRRRTEEPTNKER